MGDKAQGTVYPKSDGFDRSRRFRLADFLIVLLCLSGAAFLVNLFRLDLFSTLDSMNERPVGTIIVKNNVVQRRMANRVLWDRLAVDSPAYMGDLIRTADISSATLHIDGSSLELGEKTLIRIQRSPNGDGLIQIDLDEGSLGLAAGAGGLMLNLSGRQVELGPGTILSVSAEGEGVLVQVSKGAAIFIDEGGQRREIAEGTMVAMDADGERMEKAALAINPRQNTRYLKSGDEPLKINFAWNRINLDSGDTLRLEIAGDRNFNHIIQVIENLDAAAEAALDAGLWYWRLSSMASNSIILTERFIVTEASVPALLSPVTDSLFRYQNDLPQLRFQWSEIEGASSYILEVSDTPDFIYPRLRVQTASVFFLDSSLGHGTWYWQVMPVFPSVYEGSAAFSPAAFFRIEQSAVETALVLPEPLMVLEIEPVVVLEIEPVIVQPEPPVPVELRLTSPAAGTSIAGLTALRQQTVFTWDSDRQATGTRFILSRNQNPLAGQPVRTIVNPGRTIRLDRLEPGVYYWTVEARSPEGLISVATPRQLRVLAIPLLSAPGNLRPAGAYRIGIEELKTQSSIAFSWSAVQGANAYIFSLYAETDNGRRQIIQRPPENRTSWTLENISTLGRGTFVWQVEAVNRGASGAIEQRGRTGENTFILDIPRPGPVNVIDPGVLYVD
jgi:hypothetical protein